MSGLESLLAGKTLVKRYEIEEVIGRGGFAAVYRAADLRLGRPVAVKVITFPAPDPETHARLHARFEREARSAASLPHHPNVVTVHDFGTDPETGIDFLVMELLKGETLAQYLAREGCPPLELSLQVLSEAAEGLAVGHRSGLVHRDVKPGNIFLAEPHGEDPFRVVVVDFGIARIASEEENELTLTRTVAGENPHSPAYASPEQLAGERHLTAAADVFSLGVVAYQLLTGERPFEAGTGQRSRGRAPVRPIRELNPSVPPAVVAVVDRAMSQRPEDRYADAAEFAHAVDAAAAGAAERIVATTVPAPDDDATLIVPTASLRAAAPATVVAAPVPDDHTVIAPPRRAAPPPVEMPPSRPPDPPPARKRSPMGAFLLVLLLLAGGGAAAVWGLGGRGESDDPGGPVTPVATEDTVIEGEIIDDGDSPAGTTDRPSTAGTTTPDGDDDGAGDDDGGVTTPAPDPAGGVAPQPAPSGGVQPAPAPPPASGQPSIPPAPAPAPAPPPAQPQPQPQPRPTPPPAQPVPRPTPPPAQPIPRPSPPPAPAPAPAPAPTPLPFPVPPPPAPPPVPNPAGPRDTITLPSRPVPLNPAGPSVPGTTP